MAEIPPHERLTNLVVALMASDIGLTREQILQSVSGYRQRARGADANAASLERMFERDKDTLRSLGVRVQTIGGADPNDLRDARYRIPRDEYELPEDITFTPAEISLLKLAASAWREGSISSDTHAALQKITALGIDVDEEIVGFAPTVAPTDANFALLHRAIGAGQQAKFTYRRLGSAAPRERTVVPLAIVEVEGRWHLLAYDEGVAAPRTFLLSRFTSAVTLLNDAPTLGAHERVDAEARAIAELAELRERQRADVWVLPGSEAALRLGRRGAPRGADPHELSVGYVDAEFFADELASYGPEVVVRAPAELAAQVRARLSAVVAAHGAIATRGGSDA